MKSQEEPRSVFNSGGREDSGCSQAKSAKNLVITWARPLGFVSGRTRHVYTVQGIVTNETEEVYAARIRAYADSSFCD